MTLLSHRTSCQLKNQRWRRDASVVKIALVTLAVDHFPASTWTFSMVTPLPGGIQRHLQAHSTETDTQTKYSDMYKYIFCKTYASVFSFPGLPPRLSQAPLKITVCLYSFPHRP